MQVENLKITGMTCNGCASNVTHALEAISGVREVEVSLLAGEAAVQYDELLTSPDRLTAAVTVAGSKCKAFDAHCRCAESCP
jgi:copper chaperone